VLRAHLEHAVARGLAADGHALAAGKSHFTVLRERHLQRDERPALLDAGDVAGVNAAGFLGIKADIDGDALGAQFFVALAGDFRIGIFQRRHHARNAGFDDGVGTRRRLALMRARLERHVERCALRRLLGAAQGFGLGMRTTAGLGPAAR
jgi:hypothetical protein